MSKFSDSINQQSISSKEISKVLDTLVEMVMYRVKEQKIKDYLSNIFGEIEIKDKTVQHLVMSPADYKEIRNLAKTIFEESTYRDITERGIFGNLWTAHIRVRKGDFEMKAYAEDEKDQMEKDFPGIFDPPKMKNVVETIVGK